MNKLFCLLFATISLFAGDEIVVRLATEEPLARFYLGKVEGRFSPAYCNELLGILGRDLEQGGHLQRVANGEKFDALMRVKDPKDCFGAIEWETIPHVIKPEFSEGGLSLMLFTTKTRTLLRIKALQLSGELSEDRKAVHKLADGVHKVLFGKEGIAATRIIYSVQKMEGKEWRSEVWECDWDGGNARQLTREGCYAITPVYFPAKRGFQTNKFLYVSYRDGVPKIFVAEEGGIGKPFVTLRGNQLLPTVCRDRSKVAFICDAAGRADLFVQKIDVDRGFVGKPIQAYSFPSSVQASPTFSPDGKKIAFVSDKEGTPNIYVIDTPMGFRTNQLPQTACLTKKNRENTCPSWSPDGRKIAYSAKTDGVRQIWVYNFDDGEEKQVTEGPGHKENPSWAPNSLHLVYNRTDDETSELCVVNLHQKESWQITKGPGKKFYPAWEP